MAGRARAAAQGPKEPEPAAPRRSPRRNPPRDLRSSYVTLRVYDGIRLTQIAREVGTSVRMIELHYAGVIANWDGNQTPAERSIRAARKTRSRKHPTSLEVTRLIPPTKSLEIPEKPSVGLEPTTPSLPSKPSHSAKWRLAGGRG